MFYAHRASPKDQAEAGFGVAFEWDVDLLQGFDSEFLTNRSANPGVSNFRGCDTPDITMRLRDGGFEALLVMGWHLKSYLQGIWSAKLLGLRVLVRGDSQIETARSLAKRIAKRLIFPVGLRVFDAALYVGQRSRAYYEHYGYPSARLFFSPHCIDTAWFARQAAAMGRAEARAAYGLGEADKVVLFVGKLLPRKRPGDIIAAVSHMHTCSSQIVVVMAGSGELEEQLRVQAYEAGVRLLMLGFRNQQELPGIYRAADVLVLPSDATETWGLVANEALACGTPVILSEACGCAMDFATETGPAFSFPLGNIESLRAKIEDVLNNPPNAEQVIALSEKFSVQRAAEGVSLALERFCAVHLDLQCE